MAGKRSRKQKSVADAEQSQNKNKKKKLELQTWSDLPSELLELIIKRLTLADNIRASAVCKRWHAAAISIQEMIRSPWLMHLHKKYPDFYELYDPLRRKTIALDLPEMYGSRVCYSKDGWLLLYRAIPSYVFFLNPFTRECIELPKLDMEVQVIAFSSSPTSSSCIVFAVKQISSADVAISTCHLGASEWTTARYQNRSPFVSCSWNKIVFCNGLFYCLNSITDRLGVFDPLARTWNVLPVPHPRCPYIFLSKNWWKGKFMAEHKGDIMVVYTCCNESPMIFKLDLTRLVWEEMKTLDGMTLFVSFLSSLSKADLAGSMRNRLFFPKVRFYGRRCISYSLDDRRYYPCKQCYDWGEQSPCENIWIEPPENVSDFF